MRKVVFPCGLTILLFLFGSCKKDFIEKKNNPKDKEEISFHIESCQASCLSAYEIGIKHNQLLAIY